MNIIGWIREGDKAACGGKVAEGLNTCTSHGIPYSFQGARMACRKNCVIAEGFSRSTLANGRSQVIHGMKTSGGCQLNSTLNDIDGVGNESSEAIPLSFMQDHIGESPMGDPAAEVQATALEATSSGICLDCLIKAATTGSATVVRD